MSKFIFFHVDFSKYLSSLTCQMFCTQLASANLWVIPWNIQLTSASCQKLIDLGALASLMPLRTTVVELSSKQCSEFMAIFIVAQTAQLRENEGQYSWTTRTSNILSDSSEEHKWFLKINRQHSDQINPSTNYVATADPTHLFFVFVLFSWGRKLCRRSCYCLKTPSDTKSAQLPRHSGFLTLSLLLSV